MSATVAYSETSATPILDRKAPLPPPASVASSRGVLLAVWFALVFLGTTLFLFWHPPFVQYLGRRLLVSFDEILPGQPTVVRLLYLFAALLVVYITIAIHELGHVLVGVWVGFRFNSLRIGRLQFDRPFRISLYRGRGTGAGGWSSMFPVKQDKLVWRAVAMIFAGPAVNLLSVGVMLLLPFPPGPVSNFFTCFR